jgi:uncharacterized protein DUF4261
MNDKIVIGVPGLWPSRKDLVTGIAERSGGCLFAGNVLMDTKTSRSCQVDVYEHDPDLRRAFEIAGGRRISKELLDQIGGHTFTTYLIGSDLSPEGVIEMRAYAAAILRSGGLAVKVESTGIAHTADQWLEDFPSSAITTLYPLFTTSVGGSDFYYTCGMKNFGKPDCSVTVSVPSSVAAETMHVFNLFQLMDAPVLEDGHTFGIAADAPRYRLSHRQYGYDPEDVLDNPFGRWHLEPVS